jgi:D-alanyl-lipoteichoic acid acyltransferase DltB (MBOAT superfamily)
MYYLIPGRLRVYLLAAASIGFYVLWGVPAFLGLLILTAVSYLSARIMSGQGDKSHTGKVLMFITVLIIAGILSAIRLFPSGSIIIPIGISFFSLQALGYVADVYAGKTSAEKNFIRYLLYISFFPTVTSGPIQRSDILLRQINEEKAFNYDSIRSGLLMIAYGLFAKNFVADRLGLLVDRAYSGYETQTGFVLMLGVIIYAFQLYCDFMGYSYITLGSAKALGFELPDNFRQPYFSSSVKEFWGRWHISLSTWLRDYIYFPLGGSRKGRVRTLINIAIVFLISGVWHGRGLTFLVWGALHGIFRILEELTFKKRKGMISGIKNGVIQKILRGIFIILTFIAVDFAWLFFRAESLQSALVIVRRIFTENAALYSIKNGFYTFGLTKKELAVWFVGLLLVFIVDLIHEKGICIGDRIRELNVLVRWVMYVAFVIIIIMSGIYYYGYSAQTFIYSGF